MKFVSRMSGALFEILLALLSALLSGVPRERDRPLARDVVEVLVELLALAVGERVHRVDDDGACAPPAPRPLLGQHRVHDRDEEAQRLARPRARRDDVAAPLRRNRDGLLLVLVQRERLAGRGPRARRRAEDLGAARVERARGDEGVDRRRAFVVRVDLDERLRPVAVLRVDRLDLPADVLRVDGRERGGELLVLADDRVAEREHVHALRAHGCLRDPNGRASAALRASHGEEGARWLVFLVRSGESIAGGCYVRTARG